MGKKVAIDKFRTQAGNSEKKNFNMEKAHEATSKELWSITKYAGGDQ